jgi:hypothetical protein
MLYSALKSGAFNMRLVRPRGAARFRHLSEIFAPNCVCVCVCVCVAAGIAQSVERLARGWTVRDSNLVGAKIHTHPEPSSLLNNGYRGSFLRVRQLGRGVEHIPPSVEVKNV